MAKRPKTTMTSPSSPEPDADDDFVQLGGGRCSKYFLWLDTETTSLRHDKAKILELAAVVTGRNGVEYGTYQAVVSETPEFIDEHLSEWSKNQHTKNGLLEEVYASQKTLETVDDEFYTFLSNYSDKGSKLVLAGSSVGFDRLVVQYNLPKTASLLHFRIMDVTTLLMFFNEHSTVGRIPRKQTDHRALGDVYDSLNLYKHFVNLCKPLREEHVYSYQMRGYSPHPHHMHFGGSSPSF